MKQKYCGSLVVAFLSIFVVGCVFEKSFEEWISGLYPLRFHVEREQVLSSTPTGRVQNGKAEYTENVKVQQVIDPIAALDINGNEEIYPACVFNGDDFINGQQLKPIKIEAAKDVELNLTFRGRESQVIKFNSLGSVAEVNYEAQKAVKANAGTLTGNKSAVYLQYVGNEVSTTESLNKTIGAYLPKNDFTKWVQFHFDFDEKAVLQQTKKYVCVRVLQGIYKVGVSAKAADAWGIGNEGTYYVPGYISEVLYGQSAVLLIESNVMANELTAQLQQAVATELGEAGDTAAVSAINQLFASGKVQVVSLSGDGSSRQRIKTLSALTDFFKLPSANFLSSICTPIAYKVSDIRNHKEVTVLRSYTEIRSVWK